MVPTDMSVAPYSSKKGLIVIPSKKLAPDTDQIRTTESMA